MKIKQITSEYRNDFSADMECEHCGHVQQLTSGYHDNYYHTQVIPAMFCKACGLNRAGLKDLTNHED
jgi:transcription elongation factor Elf1